MELSYDYIVKHLVLTLIDNVNDFREDKFKYDVLEQIYFYMIVFMILVYNIQIF